MLLCCIRRLAQLREELPCPLCCKLLQSDWVEMSVVHLSPIRSLTPMPRWCRGAPIGTAYWVFVPHCMTSPRASGIENCTVCRGVLPAVSGQIVSHGLRTFAFEGSLTGLKAISGGAAELQVGLPSVA